MSMESGLNNLKVALVVSLVPIIIGCTVKATKVETSDCDLSFPKRELTTEKVDVYKKCEVGGLVFDVCFHMVGIAIPIGSAIYSSSVYLVGNTLHWMEYQGKCDEGMLRKSLDRN